MKKIIIVGSGTAGLSAAAMMKNYWGDKVQISLYYDSNKKNIAVGESTTPLFMLLLSHLGVNTEDLIRELNQHVTIKLGINYKNWIPNTEYFHGFTEIGFRTKTNPESIYSMPRGIYNGGPLYSKATTTIPDKPFDDYGYAMHIDTQAFSDYMFKKLKDKVEFIDDIVEKVNTDGENITSIECKKSGIATADLFVDASGFNALLFKNLNPKWNDTSHCLPIDRAIPQQVSYKFDEIPSYTLAEATDNGWIWRIPIGDRYGTGYLYSSKFTSDDEAREKYNDWLLENFKTELQTDAIIRYRPGYYEDYFIGNCLCIGLSSGFIEPLESTGIQIIIQKVQEFITINSTLKNLNHNRKLLNQTNRRLYIDIVNFVCLHYNTDRTDSDFWKYMTSNKIEWVQDYAQKCKEEFVDVRTCERGNAFWGIESYIQVSHGLNMFNNSSIQNFLDSKIDKEEILINTMTDYQYLEMEKRKIKQISHKKVLDYIHNHK